jgi:uncharacterized protein
VNTSLEHLPEHKQKQLREIAGIIVKAVDPEKVILFGSHATGRWVEHRYTESGITYEYISDYDILVIIRSWACGIVWIRWRINHEGGPRIHLHLIIQ